MKAPRFLVVWRIGTSEPNFFEHTSKPTALSHAKGLQRNPKVTEIAVHPLEIDHVTAD